MTRKEFISKYEIKDTAKNRVVVDKLIHDDNLSFHNYLDFSISIVTLVELSGLSRNTLYLYSKSDSLRDKFVFKAVRNLAIKVLVEAAEAKF